MIATIFCLQVPVYWWSYKTSCPCNFSEKWISFFKTKSKMLFMILDNFFDYFCLAFSVITSHFCITVIALYRVVQKMAQSLWHHNFATIRHRVVRFSAKCSERNFLHDWSQCLNTAVKYSMFLSLASELFKNSITLDTVVYKNVPLFFE